MKASQPKYLDSRLTAGPGAAPRHEVAGPEGVFEGSIIFKRMCINNKQIKRIKSKAII